MLSTKNALAVIPAVHPYFSDKNPAWFSAQSRRIAAARRVNSWWQRRVLVLEPDLTIRPAELLRQLVELGYEKVQTVGAPGEFSARGDTITILPLPGNQLYQLEFFGNRLERLIASPAPTIRSKKERAALVEERLKARFLEKLLPGDFVVHLDHGIGLFARFLSRQRQRFFEVRYARGDRLLVPENLAARKLSPYIGFGRPTIHRLGGDLWVQTQRNVKAETEAFARELLALYARRATAARPPLAARADEFEKTFAAAFPFEETPDQTQAMADVMADLNQPRLMDRVICGDVGFGKTEVAMRAMAKVVFYGRQAAVLTPTTILAQQHFETLKARFEPVGVSVGLLSRAVPAAEIPDTLRALKEGRLEIIVGTHRLLSNDVVFKNLGLAVIDEEQRFGVKQKERLKNFRGAVDVLALTATPIPRTLHLALAKVWSISNIMTPFPGKKPIRTTVAPYASIAALAAVKKELARHGQVYYLFNSVRGIAAKVQALKKALPRASIRLAHARLNTTALLKTIDDFRAKKFDILVATTIIENGLDLPNVNTLIVERAEKLGLAQAHQIRGRVGRADTQAFAYFFYSPQRLTEQAQKRLEYLERFQDLGDSLQLSLKDLELRGAGDVLGRAQSGAITAVGLNLYCQLLADAVERLKDMETAYSL